MPFQIFVFSDLTSLKPTWGKGKLLFLSNLLKDPFSNFKPVAFVFSWLCSNNNCIPTQTPSKKFPFFTKFSILKGQSFACKFSANFPKDPTPGNIKCEKLLIFSADETTSVLTSRYLIALYIEPRFPAP